MNRRALEKLLGGYAAGTLTPEERDALFAAALEDQALFDALAREQPLRDLLADPAARARLMAALEDAPPPLAARLSAWMRRPHLVALAAATAAAVIAVAVFVPRRAEAPAGKPVEIAELRQAAPAAVPEARPPAREKNAPGAAPAASPPPPPAPGKHTPRAVPPPTVERSAGPARQLARVESEAPVALPPPALPGAAPTPAESAQQFARADAAAPAPPPAVEAEARTERDARAEAAPAPRLVAPVDRSDAIRRTRAAARDTGTLQVAAAPAPLRYTAPGPLHAGKPAPLRFESRESGWLYVFAADPEGWRLLAAAPIEAHRPATLTLRFDTPGRQELLAVLSRTEQPDLLPGAVALPPPAVATLRMALRIAPQ